MNVAQYVTDHTERGSCRCGLCFDAPPEATVPEGHTVSVEFFDVSQKGADKDEYLALVRKEFPHWMDGKEHSYMETGGDIGDQGLAMQAMALGQLLGIWKLLTPSTLFGSVVSAEKKLEMAGAGYISIRSPAPEEST